MSLYVDLHQNPLSLSLLQQYLETTKELIITDIQKPIAKIVALEKKAEIEEPLTLEQIQQLVLQTIPPEQDLANELIAERRQEAKYE
jgi:antitoxin (DNA-binding transcriptional repressor) of toxin-antitoxin stability system